MIMCLVSIYSMADTTVLPWELQHNKLPRPLAAEATIACYLWFSAASVLGSI